MSGLQRFIEAQARDYDIALAEMRAGSKRSHWIWFVFPQIIGLGRSPTSRFYAIADRAEAEAYLSHPVLDARLREATEAMLEWSGKASAQQILGDTDAQKFRSSMTLFAQVANDDPLFDRAIAAFFGGVPDPLTLEILGDPVT